MANTKSSNLTVNVNFDSVAKLQKGQAELRKTGAAGTKAGNDISNSMIRADQSIDNVQQSATTAAVKFQTLSQGMLNLSTAGVQTFTSISNLDRAHNRAAASAVGLQRAQDLLNRKQLALNTAIEQGGEGSDKARLAANELATAYEDLAVKEEKAKIEQAAVLDVQLLFAANLVNVGVSSMQIMGAMLSVNQKKWVMNKLAIIGSTIATKLNTVATWSNIRGKTAATVSVTGLTIGLGGQAAATTAATIATKALTIALGPVGLIIMGISAAMLAYETNFYGFKDSVNGFLGIQSDLNEEVEEGTGIIDDFSGSIGGLQSSFEALSTPMKNYQQIMLDFAASTNDANMAVKALKLSNNGILPSGSGFSSGVGSTQSSGGTGGYSGGVSNGVGSGVSSGSTRGKVGARGSSGAAGKLGKIRADPLGTFDESNKFWALDPPLQKEVLAVLIHEAEGTNATQVYIDMATFISNATDGFTKKPDANGVNPVDIFNSLEHGNMSDILSVGTTINGQTVHEHDIVGKRGGLSSKAFMQQFKDLDNRELVHKIFGVNIGSVANSISTNDALRVGRIEMELSKFSGGDRHRKLSDFSSGDKILIGMASIISQTMGGTGQSLFKRISKVARLPTLELQQRFVENIVGIGGRTRSAILLHARRRAAEDTMTIDVPEWVEEQRIQRDKFYNSGLLQMGQIAARLQSGTGRVSVLSRSAASSFARMMGDSMALSPNKSILFNDQTLQDDFARINQMFGVEDDPSDPNSTSRRAKHRARALITSTMEAIGRSTDRMESFISSSLGIDADWNAPIKRVRIYWGGRKGNRKYAYRSTKPSVQAQIRADIGASGDIYFPSGEKLIETTRAFNTNGNFSNFNNIGMTNDAMAGLNLSEQKTFDIRFNHTRGDRELLNRLRFVEMQEAMSSGTSPL